MIKKCILLTAIILLLVSCKRKRNSNSNSKRKSGAEIIFWDYSEDFVQKGLCIQGRFKARFPFYTYGPENRPVKKRRLFFFCR